ncbi:hypothetical protein GK047_07970 [Paenibacillus sp. SYP-B3998]|uniref:Uncharacterized protein n=1 Tax=Paenibacillus sp. SYP-B3998 TaxID=2678564 RepID=A0A6G3ZW61_9BACL|nr:hypothetical protein [Paenibacillus sp. SYP-B3998]NEW05944.1 hypothetical protein [Paenibacillus sp. SYP-B3998]
MKSGIVVGQKPGIILSPLGLQKMDITRRAQNPTIKKFSIGLNAIVEEGKPNTPTILNNLRIVQIG